QEPGEIAYPDADPLTYTYGADGLRATKTTPWGAATTYTWDTASPIPLLLTETTATAATHYLYGPGGLPVAQINPDGDIWYHHHDQLGTTRALTNEDGDTITTVAYDPHGNLTHRTGNPHSPLGYAGQ